MFGVWTIKLDFEQARFSRGQVNSKKSLDKDRSRWFWTI